MQLAIASDDSRAAALLESIAKLCAAHGAQWHSELRLEVVDGSMRVLAPGHSAGPLISMPTELLVPITGAQWADTPDVLQLREPPPAATALQVDLLEMQAQLYNATAKLPWWARRHPARLVEESAEVAAALAPLKPGQLKQQIASPVAGFLATRSFHWKGDPTQEQGQPVLLPLIDCLNHHHLGAPFRIRDGAMRIQTAQAGAQECFAHYGHRRDGLDLVLHYGHCDHSTPFAHSAPLDLNVEGVGRILVEQQVRHQPAHPLDPPRVTLEPDGLKLSHLCCHLHHPERVQVLLRLALQGSLRNRGHSPAEAEQLAERGLKAIGEANVQLLQHLVAAVESSDHPGASALAEAAQRQASIVAAVLGP
jgi:hypothetical protein